MGRWKKIKGFKNYMIHTDTLQVKSLSRYVGFGRISKEKILTPNKTSGTVQLCNTGLTKRITPQQILEL